MKKYYRAKKYIVTTIALGSMIATNAFAQSAVSPDQTSAQISVSDISLCISDANHIKNIAIKNADEAFKSALKEAKLALTSAQDEAKNMTDKKLAKQARKDALATYKKAVSEAKKMHRDLVSSAIAQFKSVKKSCKV